MRGAEPERMPVHGFVLVGGQSSRMGRDKALLEFRGEPLVRIAVEKLRAVCEVVSVVGNRDDLAEFAPVVHEARVACGPAAGVEAGLMAAERAWAMFVPVDVPLVPAELLRGWAEAVMEREGEASFLKTEFPQPAFCMVRREAVGTFTRALDEGERRLTRVLLGVEGCWRYAVGAGAEVEAAFANLNTPEELAEAEGRAY